MLTSGTRWQVGAGKAMGRGQWTWRTGGKWEASKLVWRKENPMKDQFIQAFIGKKKVALGIVPFHINSYLSFKIEKWYPNEHICHK